MPQLEFRLAVMMAERKIRTVTDLTRRLKEQGVEVSSSHMTRFMKDSPPALTLPFLAALCRALECQPGDLFRWVDDQDPASTANVASIKPSAPPSIARTHDEKKVGPRIRALPRPPKRR
ncbi:MAG: helix-turn-helix transcriptional regulator [Rudaea sp.]